MMGLPDFVVPAAIATGIATVVTGLFQTYLSSRAAHDFARRLEEHKTELAERLAARSRFVERRLVAYPQLVELSYRARNIARDLASAVSPALVEDFRARRQEIQDAIFKYRIDLERDDLFELLHNFKNTLAAFAVHLQTHDAESPDPEALHALYGSIDRTYQTIITRISEEAGG